MDPEEREANEAIRAALDALAVAIVKCSAAKYGPTHVIRPLLDALDNTSHVLKVVEGKA